MNNMSCEDQMENPDPSLYSEELWEEAKGECSFFRTGQGLVIFRFTYSLSAISAFLIVYIVLRSPTKLSSIYHRIMFVMAICQMITSFSRALTTLPMPARGDYWTDILNIQGTRLGNTFTCTLQGFLIRFGDMSAETYVLAGLSAYYTCAVGFEMKIETLKKYIEPMIHIFCISLGLIVSLPPLFAGGYNVSFDNYYTMTCTVAPKPWFCNSQNSTVACVRGGVGMGEQLLTDRRVIDRYDPLAVAIILIWPLIVCYRVYKKDRELAMKLRDWDVENGEKQNAGVLLQEEPANSIELGEEISVEEKKQRIRDQYKDTKVIASQAALYFFVQFFILACELCYSYPIGNSYVSIALTAIWSIQGFYQLFIFIFHKVFNLRRHEPDICFSDALIEIFEGGPGSEAYIMSGLDAVKATIGGEVEGTIMGEVKSSADPSNIFEGSSECTPFVVSYGLSANFGSTLLPGSEHPSLFGTSLPVNDDNSNISSKMSQYHSYT